MNQYCDVVAVGHCCIDRLCVLEDFPTENGSKHILDYQEQPGGSACQSMVALSRLGVKAGYMSPLGDDDVGQKLYQSALNEGVDMSCVRIEEGVSTHFTNVLINNKNQSRTFTSYHGKFEDMIFGEKEEDYIANAKILHLDNTKSIDGIRAADIAHKYHVKVSLDGSSLGDDHRLNIEIAKKADILVTAEKYPFHLTGRENLFEALTLLDRIFAPEVLITTLGEKGTAYFKDGQLSYYPAYKIKAKDTTGAGDTYHAAFLYAYLNKYPIDKAIDFASAAAAMNCLEIGGRAGIPHSPNEVFEFQKSHEHLLD